MKTLGVEILKAKKEIQDLKAKIKTLEDIVYDLEYRQPIRGEESKMSVSVSFDIESSIQTKNKVKACDWGRLMEIRLAEQYPDLKINLDGQEGQTLTFTMGFDNRPTSEADIRSRLFSFLRYYPTMKISNLRIRLLA